MWWLDDGFVDRLTEWDHTIIFRAQVLFHSCQYGAMLLYYAGLAGPTRFPASISLTVSRGPPKYAFLPVWISGWALMLTVFGRSGNGWSRLFGYQMIVTGLITMFGNVPNQGRFLDRVHFIGSGAYMLDHLVLFQLLRAKASYQLAFCASFCLMTASFVAKNRACRDCGIVPHVDLPVQKRNEVLERAPPAKRRLLWWTELGFMFFENAIFTIFISSMRSGLPKQLST
mmetsp:Transcript_41094/g.92625  ORF Transcript_41094/g.92625 Transcript_41094/m.92625 type:complete len:228 (+) Transcript_41094:49-732(+)|eukprot:CAMPEP_0197884448 /NCGR_PEP_ID=MMETSP1439-20131203/10897_1 /TAXON_ID=66791 /ORGANISM="Gonyaulax spinifera, Strain CCMP409" /LENGTH=227 /DNA_ID=CAMNT_0043504181 /DNA_START=38 /DNA_END=721 /DNA_ORIENTATION=-